MRGEDNSSAIEKTEAFLAAVALREKWEKATESEATELEMEKMGLNVLPFGE